MQEGQTSSQRQSAGSGSGALENVRAHACRSCCHVDYSVQFRVKSPAKESATTASTTSTKLLSYLQIRTIVFSLITSLKLRCSTTSGSADRARGSGKIIESKLRS